MMKPQIKLLIVCFMVCVASAVFAADIATEVRQGGGRVPDSSDGGYLEVGGGLYYIESPIYGIPEEGQKQILPIISVNARYQVRGWFAEAFSESENGLNLGYNGWNTRHWMTDLIVSLQHGEMSENVSDKLAGLRRRKADTMGGVRFTGYYGEQITQLQLLHDVSNTHNGYAVNINTGRGWQIRNWNLHALLGARYRSKEINDYYLGVREEEASERFPVYTARSGVFYTAETGITYPLAENWVYRSFMRYTTIPRSLRDSPLVVDDKKFQFSVSLNFVF